MDSYRFIVFVENHLCKIFGFYSPWAPNLKSAPSTLCKIYYFVILFVPFVVFYLTKPSSLDDRGVVVLLLVKAATVTLLFEIYIVVYKHNIFSRNLNDFYSAFFSNDASTKIMLKSTKVSDCNYRRELMLCLLNIAVLVFSLIFYYQEFSFLRLFLIVRQLLVLPIKLQWALCVHHIDNQINRIKKLMKTTLELDDCNGGHISSRLEVYHGKRINLVKVDSVIRVYRMLAEKRVNLNEYYGTYIALHVYIMLHHLILGTYRIWYNAVRNLSSAWNYFLMIRLLFFVIDSVLLFSICETANKKVLDLREYIQKLICFYADSEQYSYLCVFEIEIQHNSMNVFPLGMFKADLRLIASICSTTVTYMLILIQFFHSRRGKLV